MELSRKGVEPPPASLLRTHTYSVSNNFNGCFRAADVPAAEVFRSPLDNSFPMRPSHVSNRRRRPYGAGPPFQKTTMRNYQFGSSKTNPKFSTVFSGHNSFQSLHNGTGWRAIVRECLCTVDWRACVLAQELVMSSFIGILKRAPATHVIDKDGFVISISGDNILQ